MYPSHTYRLINTLVMLHENFEKVTIFGKIREVSEYSGLRTLRKNLHNLFVKFKGYLRLILKEYSWDNFRNVLEIFKKLLMKFYRYSREIF